MTSVRFIGTTTRHLTACEWCQKNIGDHGKGWYGRYGGPYEYHFYFKDEAMATMFALSWS